MDDILNLRQLNAITYCNSAMKEYEEKISMRKYVGRVMTCCFCLIMVFSIIVSEPATVMAKVNMPAKSEKLVKRMSDYTTLYIVEQPKRSWTKIKINNDTIMETASVTICHYENKYCFDSQKQVHNLCYKYFGKTGYKDVTKSRCFCYRDGKLFSNGGDWGCSWPECKIVKKKKIKDGVYDIYVTNYMRTEKGILEPGEKEVEKAGESIVRIKKNKKSAFGYVVIGMKYKTTNEEWFNII